MDHELLLRMQQSDESALAALYDRYGGLVYSLALRVVGDSELAEEVLQDTFLRCWNGVAQYDASRGAIPSWLMGIARNRAIDLLRSRQHQARLREQNPLPEPDSFGEPRQADASEVIVLRHTVQEALDGLSVVQRQVIEMAYYDGLTQAEIAHRLGQPLGTVKTRTRDGMERLRRLLRPWPSGQAMREE
ncbi:MAG: sigma-70 family RNA polymerase sigma factor [Chloroflexia bacterium]